MHYLAEAADNYGIPDNFMRSVNACLQALRSVTFVLQKNKPAIEGFDEWYGSWQAKMKTDPVMKWLVQARNTVVKEGDLEAHSSLRVSVVAGYFKPPVKDFDIPPCLPTEIAVRKIEFKGITEDLRQNGFVRVERRWVANDLDNKEILTAILHGAGVLSRLLEEADSLVGGRSSGLQGRLRQLSLLVDRSRTQWFTLDTFAEVSPVSTSQELPSARRIEALEAHYGEGALQEFRKSGEENLEEKAGRFFNTAKHMLCTDGYHNSIVILSSQRGEGAVHQLNPADQKEKYVLWRRMAEEVAHEGYDEIIAISEAWFAPVDPQGPSTRAADSPDRQEGLSLVAATADGEEISLSCEFERTPSGIICGETRKLYGRHANFLAPIREAWTKQP